MKGTTTICIEPAINERAKRKAKKQNISKSRYIEKLIVEDTAGKGKGVGKD